MLTEVFNVLEHKEEIGNHKTNILPKILGSIFVAATGVLLFLDKVLLFAGIEGSNTFGFSNYTNFIWALTQSIAPIIFALGLLLKPYFLSILIPIYCYSIQIIWIFQPEEDYYYDNEFLHLYALGSCAIFVLLFILIKKITNRKQKNDREIEIFIHTANSFMIEVNKNLIKN